MGSARSFRFQPAWNHNWETAKEQILELDPDLLLLGGDLTRDGSIHGYELDNIRSQLDELPFPYRVVAGNMDTGNKHTDFSGPIEGRDDRELNVTSEQLAHFSSYFGDLNWSLYMENARIFGFCDMVAGSGLPEEKRLWRWMEGIENMPEAENTIWVTHYPLFIEDPHEPSFDIGDPDHYRDWYFGLDRRPRSRMLDLMKRVGTDLVLTGHVHCRKTHNALGIRFDIGPSTAFPQWADRWEDGDPRLGFVLYQIDGDEISSRFVPLTETSRVKGYGPGGHPRPDERDYSKAWEKG